MKRGEKIKLQWLDGCKARGKPAPAVCERCPVPYSECPIVSPHDTQVVAASPKQKAASVRAVLTLTLFDEVQ